MSFGIASADYFAFVKRASVWRVKDNEFKARHIGVGMHYTDERENKREEQEDEKQFTAQPYYPQEFERLEAIPIPSYVYKGEIYSLFAPALARAWKRWRSRRDSQPCFRKIPCSTHVLIPGNCIRKYPNQSIRSVAKRCVARCRKLNSLLSTISLFVQNDIGKFIERFAAHKFHEINIYYIYIYISSIATIPVWPLIDWFELWI